MLTLYDPYDDDYFVHWLREAPLKHLASELAPAYGFATGPELQAALNDAFEVCLAMDIPIAAHFRKVYIYDDAGITTDWLLSDLGSYLLLVNGDVHNPNVAKARMYTLKIRS